MPVFEYRHRVRYRECDPMGIVYHTHYLDYFEAARTEALRSMGLAYRELETTGVIMPVTELSIKYRRPARYDEVIVIRTLVPPAVPELRLHLDYEVVLEDDESLLATGSVALCFYDVSRQRPIAAPETIRNVFREAIGSASETSVNRL